MLRDRIAAQPRSVGPPWLTIASVAYSASQAARRHGEPLRSPGGKGVLACAAGLSVLETVDREGLLERAEKVGDLMTTRLRNAAERFDLIGDVRGRGAMVAIELVDDRATKHPAKQAAGRVIEECYRRGVVVLKAGTYGNVIRFLPPLTIEERLLDEGLGIVEEALETVAAGD